LFKRVSGGGEIFVDGVKDWILDSQLHIREW
jgi:hypothetical protein